jgi:DNA replication protein DnaC
MRISAARFPAIKTLEDFTFERLPTAPTDAIAAPGHHHVRAPKEDVILRGLGTGETHFSIALGTTRMQETRVSDSELVHHWRRGPRRAWGSALSS